MTLTVVEVNYSRISGQTGVKVCHEGGDVLCGRQHSMYNISCVDKACNKHTHKTKDQISLVHLIN